MKPPILHRAAAQCRRTHVTGPGENRYPRLESKIAGCPRREIASDCGARLNVWQQMEPDTDSPRQVGGPPWTCASAVHHPGQIGAVGSRNEHAGGAVHEPVLDV